MNKCFLYGKIISEIEFNFIFNNKFKISKVEFWIEVTNKINEISKIKVKAYNDFADSIYSKFEKDNMIKLIGRVEEDSINIIEIPV